MIAEESGESKSQVQRYIRLTNLIPELLTMTDEKQLAFNTAAELSNLLPDEQKRVLEEIEREQVIPALVQAQKMKKLSQAGELNTNIIHSIMLEDRQAPIPPKPPAPPKVSVLAAKAVSPSQQSTTDDAPPVPYDLEPV